MAWANRDASVAHPHLTLFAWTLLEMHVPHIWTHLDSAWACSSFSGLLACVRFRLFVSVCARSLVPACVRSCKTGVCVLVRVRVRVLCGVCSCFSPSLVSGFGPLFRSLVSAPCVVSVLKFAQCQSESLLAALGHNSKLLPQGGGATAPSPHGSLPFALALPTRGAVQLSPH